MSKAILISIRPEWVAKILNGEKTIEIRKTMPKCELPIDVYIYVTKSTYGYSVGHSIFSLNDLTLNPDTNKYQCGDSCYIMCAKKEYTKDNFLNGKIVAKFTLNKVEEIHCCCVPYRKSNNLGYEYSIDDGVYKVEWKENVNLCDKEIKYNNPEIYRDDGVVFERNDRYIDTMFNNEDFTKMCLTPQQLLDYINLGEKGYAWQIDDLEIFNEPKELSEFNLTKAPQSWCYWRKNK